MAVFFTSHKKTKNATDTPFIPLFNSGKQDGGYIYPKDGRWGRDNSATAEETFKIQIGISKINNFTFKCYIFLSKID
jgi:hypothetical protein